MLMQWKKYVEVKTLQKKNQTTWFKRNDFFPLHSYHNSSKTIFSPQILLSFYSIPARRSIKRIFIMYFLVYLLIVYVWELPYLINKVPISFQNKKDIKGFPYIFP